MYRKLAEVPAEPVENKSMAEQCKEMANEAQQKISEEINKFPPQKKVQALFGKILKEIYAEARKGNTTLFWSNSGIFLTFFSKTTVSHAMASALCELLAAKELKFDAKPIESSFAKGEYYVSVSW